MLQKHKNNGSMRCKMMMKNISAMALHHRFLRKGQMGRLNGMAQPVTSWNYSAQAVRKNNIIIILCLGRAHYAQPSVGNCYKQANHAYLLH